MTDTRILDWTGDAWRVLDGDYWPARVTPPGGGRPSIAPPRRQPPPCRLCGKPCHLVDDDHRPVHKTCLETHQTRTKETEENPT